MIWRKLLLLFWWLFEIFLIVFLELIQFGLVISGILMSEMDVPCWTVHIFLIVVVNIFCVGLIRYISRYGASGKDLIRLIRKNGEAWTEKK